MKKQLTTEQVSTFISTLKSRFEKHTPRHKDVEWAKVQTKLEANTSKLWSLLQMEATGGEPDVVQYDKTTDTYTFFDCATESPKGRRSVCYDHEALESRKQYKPEHSAIGMATEMGITILNEEQYRILQTFGKFDTKTSSWLQTPADIRQLGGAIFGDWRYGNVFIYHNGAESYYGARGFRGYLEV